MNSYKQHLILTGSKIKEALVLLNKLSQDAVLFVVNDNDVLLGSLTDGDVRRGFIKGVNSEALIEEIVKRDPVYINAQENNLEKIIKYREQNFRILPIVDDNKKIINVINFRKIKSYLPIDVVIMAGGRGERLRPLTDTIPKPLLQIGGKAILEHSLDRLALYGINNFWISVNYLGEQIENYFGNGNKKSININYVREKEPLGTIGSVAQIRNFSNDYVLITNSDLLTNIDYEQFFQEFINQNADLAVLSIPYKVSIPYAILETKSNSIISLKEKPVFTYYSNGGIYLMKKGMIKFIPSHSKFDATDFIEELIKNKLKVISVPFSGYWLDVGKFEDFEKAQLDIINFKP